MTTYSWPQTINGVTFTATDFEPYAYVTGLPNLIGNVVASLNTENAALAAIGSLTPAADHMIYYTSTSAAALQACTSYGRSLLNAANASALRTIAGLVIGTDVQAYHADLAAIAALTSAANKLPYATGAGTWAMADLTAAGRAILDDADAAAQRATLGLVIGTNVQAYSATLAAVAGGTYTGATSITTLGTIGTGTWGATTIAVNKGGTGATDAAGARTNLGVVIGADVQAYSATLAAVAAGTWTGATSITTLGTVATGTWSATAIAVAKGGTGATDASGARTNLGLVIGTDVLAYSASTGTGNLARAASPTFTGTPAAPTASTSDNSTQIATTAFVKAQSYITAAGAPVQSVAGKTGAVTLAVADVSGAAALAGATFTGAVLIPDGTTSAPAVAFASAPGAGMALATPATHTIAIAAGVASTTSNGGLTFVRGGPGGATSGNGGSIFCQGGVPIEGNGGSASLSGAAGVTASATNRNGGNANISAGAAAVAGTGGTTTILAGSGGVSGTAGNSVMRGGNGGSTSGAAGSASITGGSAFDGDGGNATVVGSAGVGTNRNGGNVTIRGGEATGTGAGGTITLTLGTSPSGASGNLVILNLPTSASGLPSGACYWNGNVLTRVP